MTSLLLLQSVYGRLLHKQTSSCGCCSLFQSSTSLQAAFALCCFETPPLFKLGLLFVLPKHHLSLRNSTSLQAAFALCSSLFQSSTSLQAAFALRSLYQSSTSLQAAFALRCSKAPPLFKLHLLFVDPKLHLSSSCVCSSFFVVPKHHLSSSCIFSSSYQSITSLQAAFALRCSKVPPLFKLHLLFVLCCTKAPPLFKLRLLFVLPNHHLSSSCICSSLILTSLQAAFALRSLLYQSSTSF